MRAPIRAIAASLLVLAVAALGCRREQPVPTQEPAAGTVTVVAAPPPERVAAGEAKRGVGWYPNVAVDDADRVHLAYTGAAGGFVRLALAPGGVPVVSLYHQGEHTLKVAHRPRDAAAMKVAGAVVDD